MARGQITDKWHRFCTECGEKFHINALRERNGCPTCGGGNTMTRDRNKL